MLKQLRDIDQRLRYGERVEISRDELNAIKEALAETERDYELAQEEIEAGEADAQERDLAVKTLRDLLGCLDDKWEVPPEDKPKFERIVKHAFAFINNLGDGAF